MTFFHRVQIIASIDVWVLWQELGCVWNSSKLSSHFEHLVQESKKPFDFCSYGPGLWLGCSVYSSKGLAVSRWLCSLLQHTILPQQHWRSVYPSGSVLLSFFNKQYFVCETRNFLHFTFTYNIYIFTYNMFTPLRWIGFFTNNMLVTIIALLIWLHDVFVDELSLEWGKVDLCFILFTILLLSIICCFISTLIETFTDVHLTNVAVQKTAPDYDPEKVC